MRTVDNWHKQPGKSKPLVGYFHDEPGKAFGWTYEELGWNLRWDDEKKEVVTV